MVHNFKKPSWVDGRLVCDTTLDQVPTSLLSEIAEGLSGFRESAPLVSVVIPALNEEVGILRTLHSLSRNVTSYSVEIIVVNNDSTDRTQEVLDRLGVKSFFQVKPGWGPARQMGQQNAKGKYILMADADCFYPPGWIQHMTSELMREGVTCVYGGYRFIVSDGKSPWKFAVYESLRNVIAAIRNIKRPWLNCVGMCMGYVKDLGLKIGFIDRKIRGEDGRMCYELSQIGRIVRIRSSAVTVWTFPRTLDRDGGLIRSLFYRAFVEITRFHSYFKKQVPHDTHTSENFVPPSFRSSKTTVNDLMKPKMGREKEPIK